MSQSQAGGHYHKSSVSYSVWRYCMDTCSYMHFIIHVLLYIYGLIYVSLYITFGFIPPLNYIIIHAFSVKSVSKAFIYAIKGKVRLCIGKMVKY